MSYRQLGSLAALDTVGVFLLLSAPIAAAQVGDPTQPDDPGRLGALWVQYAASLPAPLNPLNDETGANCGFGQHGKIWFLSVTLGNPIGSPVHRNCTIPFDRTIFLPVVSWVCIPFKNETSAEARETCIETNDLTDVLYLEIDGVARNDLIHRRRSGNPLNLSLAEDNIFGLPAIVAIASHDGYFAQLPKLQQGNHTIRIQGGTTAFGFTTDVRYVVKIVNAAKVPVP